MDKTRRPEAGFTIRVARVDEYDALGEITARAYLDDGLLDFGEDDRYLKTLRDVAARAAGSEVFVAVDGDGDGMVLGGVAYVGAGSAWADLAGEGEAEFRMLAVAPGGRGRGVGGALVRACVDRARATGCVRVRLSTQKAMPAAHRIYERLGFVRTPERDWAPYPGLLLLTYSLEI